MTTVAATARASSPQAPGPAPAPQGLRTELRVVSVLVVLLLLTQRIGIPVGGEVISIAVPLAYAFVAYAVLRHLLVVSKLRAELFTVAVAACLLTTAAVSWLGLTRQFSMSSLGLLIILYLPWVFRVRGAHGAAVVARAGRAFVQTMLVLSALGIAQLAGQLAGVWEWTDHLREVVPSAYVIPGYNFDNELTYGIGVFKGTAFVLLEPSFLSQFCALAILIGILLRSPAWQLLLLGGGLASAVSGTGIILLGAGAVLLLAREPRRLRPGYVLAGGLVGALLLFSPVSQYLRSRQGEFSEGGTSGNARFVAPYREAWEGLTDDPIRFFVGAGPGSVDRLIPGTRVGINGTDVLYSVVPKLVFEYGLIAGGLFVLFLAISMLDRAPWRVIPAALVLVVFVLSGALLQPQTAVLAWLLAGIGATEREADRTSTASERLFRPARALRPSAPR